MAFSVFETGNTIQFTWTSSLAPDAAPSFAVRDSAGTLLASMTSVTSDTTHYSALYTIPTSPVEAYYMAEWRANKTLVSSSRAFVRKIIFKADETTTP